VNQAKRVVESNFNFLRNEWPELSDSASDFGTCRKNGRQIIPLIMPG
jgi:hypothetical protein